jgi:3-hydroxybutyryl-CoA dehydratase
MKVGDVVSCERTFTKDDILHFNEVSGDQGVHHVTPDDQGRLMIHGLLTATLPTKIGGDMDFIAREMKFQFHRPVFSGDTVTCAVTVAAIEIADRYTNVRTDFVCTNQHGKEVMSGYAHGIIR